MPKAHSQSRASPTPRLAAPARLSLVDALWCLPRDARFFVIVVLLSVTAPSILTAYGAFAPADDRSLLGAVARRPLLLVALATGAVALALLALVRPRSSSPRAYVAQLRERLHEIRHHFDAAFRRRFPEPQENTDVLPHEPR